MNLHRSWKSYRAEYRVAEMKTIASWIANGDSGSVVGAAGIGVSNLLGFLCYRPDAIQRYLPEKAPPVALVPVDLNDLPVLDTSTLYRVILRSFYEVRAYFDAHLLESIEEIYQSHRAETDPFLTQSALRELLLLCQAEQIRCVLVLDHFDNFCQIAPLPLFNTLRGLRDSFKNVLIYVVGLRQKLMYLPEPDRLGRLQPLLDRFVCWVGPMNTADARQLIRQTTYFAQTPIGEVDIERIIQITGGHPSLLREVSNWWQKYQGRWPADQWPWRLLAEPSIDYWLKQIWARLTLEEQLIMSEIQKLQPQSGLVPSKRVQTAFKTLFKENELVFQRLVDKGLCHNADDSWSITGRLLSDFLAQTEVDGRGKIRFDERGGELLQGQQPITGLSPLSQTVLTFLIENPYTRHTKTDLIFSTWPDELRQEGVTDDSLYQVIMEIRKKIEPNSSEPRYLVTRRGKPEGGYQFFPEGRPS